MRSSNDIICSPGECEDINNILCINNNVGKCTVISGSCGIDPYPNFGNDFCNNEELCIFDCNCKIYECIKFDDNECDDVDY
jgi:hypothetical protein